MQTSPPFSGGADPDFSDYFVACSTLRGGPVPGNTRVLQAVDRSTGVVFERVHQGGRNSSEDVRIHSPGYSSDLSFQLVPSAWLSMTDDSLGADAMNIDRPSMMLTLPTPVMPHSPVFVPQSPITVSKFFEALDPPPAGTPADHTRSLVSAAPPLASCGECGLVEFEQGIQCRACDQQWLACKVWYRAHDGGRRRWLSAPYILPGESNARNRALMHDVGLPGCCAPAPDDRDGTGADIEPVRARRRLRRVRRFVRERAVRARGVLRIASSRGRRLLCPLRRSFSKTNTAAARLAHLWATLACALRSHAHDLCDTSGFSGDNSGDTPNYCGGARPGSDLRDSTEQSPCSGIDGAYATRLLRLGWFAPQF